MAEIRVLHVLHSMNCGGAEALIMNIYRSIDRSKIQFDFLVNVFDEMYYQKEIEELGGRVYRMKFLTSVTPPIYERNLYKFFKAHPEYKIVHSHLETTTGLILKQAKRAGVPVRIAHSHNTRYTRVGLKALPENTFKTYCRKKIPANATNLLACSKAAAKWLYGDSAAEIISNGINVEKYEYSEDVRKAVRAEFHLDEDVKLLIHVGRFCNQKNHSFLVDIFSEYSKLNPNSLLFLVGEGPLMDPTIEKAADLGISDKVRFLGVRGDVPSLLQAADCFLLPSFHEGLPVVLVEAQTADLPCIVSDLVPGDSNLKATEYIELPLNSPGEWAKRISETDGYKRSSKLDVIRAAGFDITSTARRVTEIYLNEMKKIGV